MPNYVKIPKEIVYDKGLTDKRVIIFSYLCARRSLDDTVAFSITELCHWSRLKPNYRDGKINQKYYEVLLLLSHYEYFLAHPDFKVLQTEKKNSTDYQILKLNPKKFDIPDNFGLIYFDELSKILNFKGELEYMGVDLARMSSSYILLVLAYLRANMNRDVSRPLCCYRLYKKIQDDTGISERYISRIIDILNLLDIIRFKEIPKSLYLVEDGKKKFRTNPKVFANVKQYIKEKNGVQVLDKKYDAFKEIDKQIALLKNQSFTQ